MPTEPLIGAQVTLRPNKYSPYQPVPGYVYEILEVRDFAIVVRDDSGRKRAFCVDDIITMNGQVVEKPEETACFP
jgi:hypothetical protein